MKELGFQINRPAPGAYRFAVYCGSTLLDLRHEPENAVGLFANKRTAEIFGGLMWPNTFAVVDLAADQEQADA